ncbi:MAG TPA: HDOD domain-containing protein [Tepidisphaeraceae bacterium]|nr:HDOD domain-containing protein [Tepidisphaeraceae bacterium]
MASPDPKRAELIVQQLEQLPTLPAVAVRVLEVTANDSAEVSEVVRLIHSDQSLTTRILQLCNRAEIGLRNQITTVERAVILLGFEAVRSAVLAVSVFQTFGPATRGSDVHFKRDEFWKHSIAVACAAERLADLAGHQSAASEAFVCGLLHDLGKVALDAVLPKSFDKVVEAADLLRGDIADIERSVIGIDHMVIGKRLAERWALPPAVRDCIWLHGQNPSALPSTVADGTLVNLITLADAIARQQHVGYSGNYHFTASPVMLCQALKLSAEDVQTVRDELIGVVEPRAAALGVGESSSTELYQQALTRANQELGRVSDQLAQKNRKLTVRAKFFEALSQFHGGLRADGNPRTVLEAIGQTARQILDVPAVCVFSLPPRSSFAEALIVDVNDASGNSRFVDAPGALDAGGNMPRTMAADSFDWLLNDVSPNLPPRSDKDATGHPRHFWIPMLADGSAIGGVVWTSLSNEAERLGRQEQEIAAVAGGWGMALRTAQIRDESRILSENLAEVSRKLQASEAEVLRAKMVTSIAEMAAGAAHEMNNPLAVISGWSQRLAQEVTDPRQTQAARQIHDQADKLSAIITELMDYAKPQPANRERTDLLRLIDRAVRDAKKRCTPEGRKIEMAAQNVPGVLVDSIQVAGALQEIVENAIQSTDPHSGHIAVKIDFDAYSLQVVVTVEDNGCGMDEAALRRAFDPFFSQKAAGRRRGMGLAKALRWIEGSGGTVRLESEVGKGTRAIVLLPAEPATDKRSAAARRAAT